MAKRVSTDMGTSAEVSAKFPGSWKVISHSVAGLGLRIASLQLEATAEAPGNDDMLPEYQRAFGLWHDTSPTAAALAEIRGRIQELDGDLAGARDEERAARQAFEATATEADQNAMHFAVDVCESIEARRDVMIRKAASLWDACRNELREVTRSARAKLCDEARQASDTALQELTRVAGPILDVMVLAHARILARVPTEVEVTMQNIGQRPLPAAEPTRPKPMTSDPQGAFQIMPGVGPIPEPDNRGGRADPLFLSGPRGEIAF